MAKNFFIFTLIILCGVMLVSLFKGDNDLDDYPLMTKFTNGKLSNPELIENTVVNGVSLNTPVQDINTILADEPYKCRTSEKEVKTEDNKIIHEKFWACSHNSIKGANLRIHAVNNVIKSIVRNGPSTKQEVKKAGTQLDLLKLRIKDFKGFSMNQSENNVVFQIHSKLEDGTPTSMSYRMQIIPVRDPKNPPPHEGMLSISLVR